MENNDRKGISGRRFAVFAALACAALAVGGCGGGSSGSSGSGSSSSSVGAIAQTFSVSGTVSGLNSAGLVLMSNGAQVAVADGVSTVALASGLSTGSAYTVSVQTQPASETCTVADGAGTVSSANVANVVVTCADQAYSLGGTISGLNGSGLVLANGSDSLTVSSGATSFTMPTQVAFSSSYDVTVKTQPAGLSCAVSQGSGTMPGTAVSNVTVNCTDQSFTLGGTIAGLGNSGGLVLVNGSDTLNVAAPSTVFTMPTAVAFGSSYAVQVQSSPAGLTCSVAQGGGVMGAGANTQVVVTCSDQSYALGGTIAGLNASGLVLANGSDTVPLDSGAKSFTMPTAVAYGSPYTVAVQSNPTGETCTVGNASSTMPAGAVTNVAVVCSVTTFTIGGTISGLSSMGLVLLDNGGNPTSIAANATLFTLGAGIAYGGGYAVSVQTQPAGETCQISQPSGSNLQADVTGISITCAPWSSFTTSVLYSFAGGSDGASPNDSLIEGTDGKLYGDTSNGGTNNTGTIFSLTLTGSEAVVYSFGASASGDGINPYAALILGGDGNLYGTTGDGGAHAQGTMFKVTTAGAESIVYSFAGGTGDGARPNGAVLGSDGNFYGTTPDGGAHGMGTIYVVTAAGAETVLHSFAGGTADGSTPEARLLQGGDGNYYGTTSAGGANNAGTVFRITPAGVETVLYSFGSVAGDGSDAMASLIQGTDGNFYSTTTGGGANNLGTVFKITPAGVETVIYSFGTNANDGTNPFARLMQAADGNLYGTTPTGGANGFGIAFKVTTAGAETILHAFTGGADGGYPQNSLIAGSDGNLYSTTLSGGANNQGTVFKIVPQ
jgi:uncharacterized repeat protein (TIGR03803 family)